MSALKSTPALKYLNSLKSGRASSRARSLQPVIRYSIPELRGSPFVAGGRMSWHVCPKIRRRFHEKAGSSKISPPVPKSYSGPDLVLATLATFFKARYPGLTVNALMTQSDGLSSFTHLLKAEKPGYTIDEVLYQVALHFGDDDPESTVEGLFPDRVTCLQVDRTEWQGQVDGKSTGKDVQAGRPHNQGEAPKPLAQEHAEITSPIVNVKLDEEQLAKILKVAAASVQVWKWEDEQAQKFLKAQQSLMHHPYMALSERTPTQPEPQPDPKPDDRPDTSHQETGQLRKILVMFCVGLLISHSCILYLIKRDRTPRRKAPFTVRVEETSPINIDLKWQE